MNLINYKNGNTHIKSEEFTLSNVLIVIKKKYVGETYWDIQKELFNLYIGIIQFAKSKLGCD